MEKGKAIHCIVMDEGASTCVMSASSWLALSSPTLSPPSNFLKAFYGHTFIPRGYRSGYPITLCGKTVMVDIKFVDRHLDYNHLLGCCRTYAMNVIVSSVFKLILFPLDEKIVRVDKISLYTLDYTMLPSNNVP